MAVTVDAMEEKPEGGACKVTRCCGDRGTATIKGGTGERMEVIRCWYDEGYNAGLKKLF